MTDFSLGVAAVVLAASLGCSRSTGYERYTPAPEPARRALDAALTGWKTGQPVVPPPGSAGAQLDDLAQRQGRKLADYEVLGEVTGDGGRWFDVQLEFDAPAETRQVRYVVVGIDPLWVMRNEDYDMMRHWEHPMEPPSKTATGSAKP